MNFLEKIRNSSEQIKRKWLFGLTAISMVLVIIAWIAYMNVFVFSEAGQNENKKIEISFWPTLKSGISGSSSNLKENISEIFSKIKNLGGEKKITIENK